MIGLDCKAVSQGRCRVEARYDVIIEKKSELQPGFSKIRGAVNCPGMMQLGDAIEIG